MIHDDERAALERELEADLDKVILDGDDGDGCETDEARAASAAVWTRRDMDELLRPVEAASAREERSAWTLLLQSVELADREVFGAMRAEMDALRATYLTPGTDRHEQAASAPPESSGVGDAMAAIAPPGASSAERSAGESARPSEAAAADMETSEGEREALRRESAHAHGDLDLSAAGVATSSPLQAAPPAPPASPSATSTSPLEASSAPLDAGHGAGSWLALARQRWEEQQREAARWLARLEADAARLAAEQQQHAREQREEAERARMQCEDALARALAERRAERLAERQARAEMRAEDEAARAVGAQTRRERAARREMQAEDEAARLAEQWRAQRAAARALASLAERARARQAFARAFASLAEHSRAKQLELLERERRRVARESSLMRAEEAQTRRWLAQTRAVAAALERARMSREDALARELERHGRRERAAERRRRDEMREQERLSARAWRQEAERARERQAREREGARRLQAAWRRRRLACALGAWRRGVAGDKESAGRIQRWWRARPHGDARVAAAAAMEKEEEEDGEKDEEENVVEVEAEDENEMDEKEKDESEKDENEKEKEEGEWTPGAADAAKRLQSAARGFVVRRKFQAALALARAVGGDGDDELAFRALDLDELIALPPELADGWEDPVLPRGPIASRRADADAETAAAGHGDDRDERVGGGGSSSNNNNNNNNNSEEEEEERERPAAAAKDASLAASIWSRMRRGQHKHKLLRARRGGKSPALAAPPGAAAAATAKAPTIAWTTSGNAPKPRAKLPSLVERLRLKTAAERRVA